MAPLPWISAAAASAWTRSLAAMSTRAPWPAKTRAIPFPIPLLAPVTMTERPSIDVSMCDPFGFEVGATREIQTPTASFGQVFDSLLGEQPTRARRWLASKFLYFPPDPHQHGSLRPIFGVMTDLSGDQVRRGKADKFTRCDDLSL